MEESKREELRSIRFKQIKAVYETLTIHEATSAYLSPNSRYTSPEQIYETFRYLRDETREYFLCLHLDGKNRVVAVDVVSIGSLNQSIVHPREVFKSALLSSAAAIVLLHNHPSGDPAPSREDLAITGRIKDAGEILGIRVLDHLIVGTDGYVSLAAQGVL